LRRQVPLSPLRTLLSTGWLQKLAEKLILAALNTQSGTKRNSNLIEFVFRRMLSALPQRIFMRACYVGCVRTITEAAKMGCCDAAVYLGFYNKRKYDAPIAWREAKFFFDMAVEYFIIAAHQERTEAQYMLGMMFLEKNNKKEAKEWLKRAALKGHARSQFSLGHLHDIGLNEKALHWYTLAAKQGHVEAQYILACKSELSNKYDDAVLWFRLASPRLVIADENLLTLLIKHPGLRQETDIEFFEANSSCDRSTLKKRWFNRK
jgi:TPR repeat protein